MWIQFAERWPGKIPGENIVDSLLIILWCQKSPLPQNLKKFRRKFHLQKFILKVDVSNIKIDTLSYDIKDTAVYHLTPKQGTIKK